MTGSVGGFLDVPAYGTAQANGTVTITFPSIPSQQHWQGVVSVPTSPSTTKWSVQVNGRTVVQITGTNGYALALNGGDTLSVTGTGAVNVQYQGTMHGQYFPGTRASGLIIPQAPQNTIELQSDTDSLFANTQPINLPLGLFTGTGQIASVVAQRNYETIEVNVIANAQVPDTNPAVVAIQVFNSPATQPAPRLQGSGWQTGLLSVQAQSLAFMGSQFFFPISAIIGDTISVYAFLITAGGGATPLPVLVDVLGHTIYKQPYELRQDGRRKPMGMFIAQQANGVTNTSTNITNVAGFPAGTRALLRDAQLAVGFANAAGGQDGFIAATARGNSASLVTAWVSSAQASDESVTYVNGLLCDPATEVKVGQGTGPSTTAVANITYDLVV